MEKSKLYPIQKAIMCFSEPRIYSPSLAATFRIDGKIDKQKLEKVIDNLVRRNDAFSFRFVYDKDDDEIYQYTEDTCYTLDERKAVGETEDEKLQSIRDMIDEVRRDASENSFKGIVPWKIILFEIDNDKYLLYARLIHIITDGMSIGILANKIISEYNGISENETIGMTDYFEELEEFENSGKVAELIKANEDLIQRHIEYKAFLKFPEGGERNYAKFGEFVTLKKDKLEEVCRKNRLSYFHVVLFMTHAMFSVLYGTNETRLTIPTGTRKKKYMATIGPLLNCYFSRIDIDDNKTMLENAVICRDLNLRESKTATIMPYVIREHEMPLECIVTYQSYITNFGESIPFGEAKARAYSDTGMTDYYYANCFTLSGLETNEEIVLTLRTDEAVMDADTKAKGAEIYELICKCLTDEDMTFGEFKKLFRK